MLITEFCAERFSEIDVADRLYAQANKSIEKYMSEGYKLYHINVVVQTHNYCGKTYSGKAFILMFKNNENTKENAMDNSILMK